jgi:hypothetical protein
MAYAITDRQRRVGLHLSVDVKGRDAMDVYFSETTRTLNVSGGGICFESRRNLPVGARLVVEIRLPERLRRHFGGRSVYRARAVVCRLEHFEGQPVYRVGARFLGEAP